MRARPYALAVLVVLAAAAPPAAQTASTPTPPRPARPAATAPRASTSAPARKPTAATGLRLEGRLVQGGLVIGTTQPGTRVDLGDRELRVSEQGRFLFGLSRTQGRQVTLTLTLPGGREVRHTLDVARRRFRTQRIDNLPESMVTPPEAMRSRILAEQTRLAALWGVDTPEPLFESGFAWPARGPISGVYGSQRILNGKPRNPHWGIDIAAPAGAPVTAPADGIVLLAQPDFYYTGGTLLLDHGFGLVSAFLHLSGLDVTLGQRVRRGDMIGRVGSTGRSTGPHLDWRLRWLDVFVDPQLLVPAGRNLP